jgi:hypothetical protein
MRLRGSPVSATGRGSPREPDDFYATPAWATEALLTSLLLVIRNTRGRCVVDPFAGEGAILDVAKQRGFATRGIEINAERVLAARMKGHPIIPGDALSSGEHCRWCPGRGQIVVTNPPYSPAMAAVSTHLVNGAGQRIGAFLLRLNWLGSAKRRDFHRKYPCDLKVLSRRPEFATFLKCKGIKGGAQPACGWRESGPPGLAVPRKCPKCGGRIQVSRSDATEYAWMIWGPGFGGRYEIL